MTALDMLEVDRFGLDEIDQKIMRTVLEKFSGGPVGVNTIAASIGEESETIEEDVRAVSHPAPDFCIALAAWTDCDGAGVRLLPGAAPVRRRRASAGVVLKIVYLALGSNVGNREEHLRKALEKLQARDLRLRRASSLYETEPMGLREQRGF